MILEWVFQNNIWGFSSFNPVHRTSFNTNSRKTIKSLTGCELGLGLFFHINTTLHTFEKRSFSSN